MRIPFPFVIIVSLLLSSCANRQDSQSPGAEISGKDLPPVIANTESKDTIPPRPIVMSNPIYPYELLRANVKAAIVVDFVVDLDGRVMIKQIHNSPDRRFDEAIIDAATRWKFEPATRSGIKVKTLLRTPISFDIK